MPTPLLPPHLRKDDPTIPDKLVVWRVLDPAQAPVDATTGVRKIMSDVFRTEEMSVYMSDQIALAQVQVANSGCFVAEFSVAVLRRENCIIARDPNDYAHGLIYDAQQPGDRRITRGQAHRIRNAASLIT